MTTNKLVTRSQAAEQVKTWQAAGEKVVFTNGCFDILHRGHVEYLEKSAALGNHMVLGLNTDASVSRLKGPTRPMVDEDSRAVVMSALECVSLVVFFDEDTPLELIEALKPDILTKGDDYTVDNIVGANFVLMNGGSVKTVKLTDGFSTTRLIQKIQNLK
ncbi:MAG: D-glycero-beta-D-manno-heptose 1-phosphate adenylyltransferase [Bacteroidota bacterium]